MSPIKSRRFLKDYADRMQKLNPLRRDMSISEYDDAIVTLAKIASVILAALFVIAVFLQITY